MQKPITIRALFGEEILTSCHTSARRVENWRYHAREIADMAVALGAEWAQGWVDGERVAWIVSRECEESLRLSPRDGERRVRAEQVYEMLEFQTPIAGTVPAGVELAAAKLGLKGWVES